MNVMIHVRAARSLDPDVARADHGCAAAQPCHRRRTERVAEVVWKGLQNERFLMLSS